MADVKRTLLVRVDSVAKVASILTGWGRIVGIDHEGTITYEVEGENEFALGRLSHEIQSELRTEFRGAEVIGAVTERSVVK